MEQDLRLAVAAEVDADEVGWVGLWPLVRVDSAFARNVGIRCRMQPGSLAIRRSVRSAVWL